MARYQVSGLEDTRRNEEFLQLLLQDLDDFYIKTTIQLKNIIVYRYYR